MGIWLARFVRMLGSYSFYARLHRDRNRAKRFALTASCESIGLRRAHAVCHYMRIAMARARKHARATRGDALLHPAAQACCTTYQAKRIDVSQRVSDGCVLGASGFPVFCIRSRVVHDSAASTPGCIVRSVAVSARPVSQSARTNRQGAKPNNRERGASMEGLSIFVGGCRQCSYYRHLAPQSVASPVCRTETRSGCRTRFAAGRVASP